MEVLAVIFDVLHGLELLFYLVNIRIIRMIWPVAMVVGGLAGLRNQPGDSWAIGLFVVGSVWLAIEGLLLVRELQDGRKWHEILCDQLAEV